ncbi:NADPH:quinone reductase or related Zn-dependent oxidoreductase [Chromobacterium violaceum]|uniref:Zinc-type alcohol dehydrogenase-like protein n=2 Tax=Chromobacterium violaceum TaxID=536 RepID=Q7NXJ6_CHRVO|nr:zinc-binding alcohol dehydrogenase family protein [Chromobacterium violaceum]AAQ59306.1 probable oxidoreductase [Chromobacterium violaceum ATCC 12472]ATP28265.1 zinc-binding alcohol dehydrogenase family protein [Chromobacterium violaceum]ATP32173.1 zinc-binding alcohol dehydrogenase family protein [Chromobacterium violaceum]MBP4046127.1 zinc-binding alcohol dehydrogenase family protein [Chromobacterium violaceum]MBT2867027.1 zinc-binding alcohol dehydrogenase family protein [Chromobacterium
MKAVAYYQNLPISHPEALQDVQLPEPVIGERDLLVEVQAISVNPVDVKVRANMAPEAGQPKVLGWDVAGVVRAVGAKTTLFQPGDRVWYAGALQRPGANSELHAVDERIVGRMPDSLDFETAAALPLTAITAWELLFDRLQVLANGQPAGRKLMIVGAAGGVGSIMIQLARQLTGLTVIATASRPETQAWVRELGAHHVIDHSQPLSRELKRIGIESVDYVASLNQTDAHFGEIVESLAPQGKLALIDDPAALDARPLKVKSISLHWEFMYTRSMFATDDQIEQHKLLTELARLVDAGIVKSTVAERFGAINAANLKRAHALLESNAARGKIVLSGF